MDLFKNSYLEYGYPLVINTAMYVERQAPFYLDFDLACTHLKGFLRSYSAREFKDFRIMETLQQNLPRDKKVLLLFSGGKDSTLLAKLLELNNNETTLVHFRSSKALEKVVTIAKSLRRELIVIDNFASTTQLISIFKDAQVTKLICGGTNVLGLASLSRYVDLRKFDIVVHGQGSDSLSSAVHNQIYNLTHTPLTDRIAIAQVIYRHFALMTRKKNWLKFSGVFYYISKRLTKIFLDHCADYLYSTQIQILIAYYFTFIPIDGHSFKQFESVWKLPVYSPFHMESSLRSFLDFPQWRYEFGTKPQIDFCLETLGLNGLDFLVRGFNLPTVGYFGKSTAGVYQVRKELYSNFLNEKP